MSEITGRITIDVQQIAEIAGVGRSAVGNWRKRHADFPVPDSSGRFDLREVERWLIENGKLDRRIPAEVVAWSLADRLRGSLSSSQITRMLVAILVYLEACERAASTDDASEVAVRVEVPDRWDHVCLTPPEDLAAGLRAVAARIEDANPPLVDLVAPGFDAASSVEGELLRQLVDNLAGAVDESSPRFDLFEEVVSRAGELDRFRGEHATPGDVTELMVRLADQGGGTVVDLACGEGGLLLSAAVHPDRDSAIGSRFVGFELNEEVLRIARARFFLYGVDAELRLADAFRVPPDELPSADLVLLDPPLGQRDWGDADLYVDDRWTYGIPPRNNADLAWMQLAVHCLAEGGRAIVVTTTGPAFRAGSEAKIRRAMLEAGVIEAIVQLPGRLRADTSIPLSLWVLRSPDSHPPSVLFVDASSLGTTGRSQHAFDEGDIGRIVAAVRAGDQAAGLDPDIAWIVDVDRVLDNEAVLDPTRYRPAVEVDLDELHRRADELRQTLPTLSTEADEAVRRLLSRLAAREG